MKKITTIFLLIILSADAMAEWIPVTSDKNRTMYIEYSRIRITGNIRKAWILVKYKKPEMLVNTPYSSSMTQYELNCKDESLKINASTYYDKSGNLVDSLTNKENRWSPVTPETNGELIWQLICNRKL